MKSSQGVNKTEMTQEEMFEKSFGRPKNYFKLPPDRQWEAHYTRDSLWKKVRTIIENF